MNARRPLLLAIAPLLFVFACGSAQKPPPVEEVPIDKGHSGGGDDGNGGGGSGSGSGSGTSGSGGGGTSGNGGGGTGGSGSPTPLTTDDKPDAGSATPAPSATGPTHPGGLTAKECDGVINKFLTMMSAENHIPLPDLNGQTGQLGDALSGMKGECSSKTTKKQYTCAMASRNTAGWKKCME